MNARTVDVVHIPLIDVRATGQNIKRLREAAGISVRDLQMILGFGSPQAIYKCPNGDAKEFSNRAKLEHNLLVVPTDSFGAPGYMRLSYCVSFDTIKNSIPAFKEMYEYYTK